MGTERVAKSGKARGPNQRESSFQDVFVIALGHFCHDVYSAFLAPLLPILRERLGLSYAAAGGLAVFTQLPSLLNPLFGHLADRVSLRWFVILAPAVTGTLMCSVGLPSDYVALAFLLLATGVSIAAFHAPAPAMIGDVAGRRTGTGMSLFMAAGELARTVGPLLAVAGVGWFGLEGLWRLGVVGWLVSGLLYWRLGHLRVASRPPGHGAWSRLAPGLKRVFPVLVWLLAGRALMQASLTTYLPIFMRDERHTSLALAAASLTVLEGAGFVGALLSGTISDTFGRRRMLATLAGLAPLFMLAFLFGPDWLIVPMLLAIGLTMVSMQPVLLALVQDEFPENRAFANGTYLALGFLSRAVAIAIVGLLADALGLVPAFALSAAGGVLAFPAVFFLPRRRRA